MPEARLRHLDHFLAGRLSEDRDHDRPVAWAMDRLAAADGPVTSRLAEEIGWSRRHFIRRFRAATGFSPDRFRRLTRFERFVGSIMRSPADGLAGLAADSGYVDQAHLTRDVRDFSDMTPGELRARLIPGGGGVRDD
jgi:transcriptional regulator GlxA family with amidase domain